MHVLEAIDIAGWQRSISLVGGDRYRWSAVVSGCFINLENILLSQIAAMDIAGVRTHASSFSF